MSPTRGLSAAVSTAIAAVCPGRESTGSQPVSVRARHIDSPISLFGARRAILRTVVHAEFPSNNQPDGRVQPRHGTVSRSLPGIRQHGRSRSPPRLVTIPRLTAKTMFTSTTPGADYTRSTKSAATTRFSTAVYSETHTPVTPPQPRRPKKSKAPAPPSSRLLGMRGTDLKLQISCYPEIHNCYQ